MRCIKEQKSCKDTFSTFMWFMGPQWRQVTFSAILSTLYIIYLTQVQYYLSHFAFIAAICIRTNYRQKTFWELIKEIPKWKSHGQKKKDDNNKKHNNKDYSLGGYKYVFQVL